MIQIIDRRSVSTRSRTRVNHESSNGAEARGILEPGGGGVNWTMDKMIINSDRVENKNKAQAPGPNNNKAQTSGPNNNKTQAPGPNNNKAQAPKPRLQVWIKTKSRLQVWIKTKQQMKDSKSQSTNQKRKEGSDGLAGAGVRGEVRAS